MVLVATVHCINSYPISVPVDTNYYNQYYNKLTSNQPSYSSQSSNNQAIYSDNVSSNRRPNSYFNRLPQNSVQTDDVAGTGSASNNDYDYDDQQTDNLPPEINSSAQQSTYPPANNYNSNENNLNNNQQLSQQQQQQQYMINYLNTQNRHPFRKRKRYQPCIPIQSLGSSLYSNRLKRAVKFDPVTGKTFHVILGDLNYPQGSSQHDNVRPQFDNVKPQYDSPEYNRPQYDNTVNYQPNGGFPCIPVAFGQQSQGLFGGNGPLGLFGGGGGGGPLGFFGQGGLLDFNGGNNQPLYSNLPNRPIIINRPIFQSTAPGAAGGLQQDQNQPGFWGTVVTGLNPSQVITSVSDAFNNAALALMNTPTRAFDAVRNVNREFGSLIF
ncbi:unnamed protein product [Diamesa tonsa]